MRRSLPVLLPLLLVSSPAWSAAYYFLDAGTRGLSRGGAFVAGADDISAQWYNPAGLIHVRGTQATIDMTGVSQYVLFDRADEGDLVFEAVTNDAPPMAIPSFGVSTDFGLDKFTFALGLYPPYAPDMSYPEDGPQRYTLVDTLVLQAFAGPSVAWQPKPWLTVGGGVAWTFMKAEQELTVAMCAAGADCGDNVSQDVNIRLEALEPARVIWNAGVLVEPTEWLSVGASVVPPITFRAEGTITADFGEDFGLASLLAETSYTDDDIVLVVPMPLIARLGVAVRPMPNLEVELASVYEGWHVSEVLLVDEVDLAVTFNEDSALAPDEPIVLTDDIELKTGYQDTISARLGADWDINPRWTARAGTFLETSGVPKETQGVGLVDGLKFGYGVGGGVQIVRPLTLDLGVSQSFIQKREITDSEVTMIQLNLDLGDPEASGIIPGKVVGNGTFASHLTMVSAGLTWRFGKGDQPEG